MAYSLNCFYCDKEIDLSQFKRNSRQKTKIIQFIRDSGWTYGNKLVCPECAKKYKVRGATKKIVFDK